MEFSVKSGSPEKQRSACTHTGLDVGGRPSAEGSGAAGVVHQGDQGAQDDQEDQDGDVDGVDHTNTLAGTDKVLCGLFCVIARKDKEKSFKV